MDAVITANLSKYYGRTVGIAGLDLCVKRGEIYGFLGPNGAGKTTTIRLLIGLLRPSRGKVMLLGLDAETNRRALAGRIGYLPGELGLYPDLSGDAYLRHLLRLRMKRIPRAIEERLGELQARFEVDFGRKIRTYSKGMRQAIGIIQAFMHRPDLAVLDEPTSGLDPVMQERFHDLLLEERERGAAVFLSSHILMEVARTCDRVAMLKNGRLLGVDTIESYRARVGKRITIETARPAGALREWLETAGGVTGINAGPNRIEFYFTGDMQSLLRWIRTVDVVDFTCERPDVETVFRSLYRDERRHE